ncbi:MAG: putative transcriptional regulator [uncultured archaeon A07HR60]|nr:MAG: putative transcriptional regulator [uncultured archaeon A07HR60]
MVDTDLIEVLGTEYNVAILVATEEPKSAKQLSTELDVPIATCYRRIDQLEEAGLLELHDRPLSDERRRVKVYRRAVENVEIDFNGALNISVDERTAAQTELDTARQRFVDN